MAKGAYIGVSSVAKKVKKMYIGVGGVARKVKKAYIGVGGKARLWWSGESSFLAVGQKVSGTYGSFTFTQYIAKDKYDAGTTHSPNVGLGGWSIYGSEITKFNNRYITYGMIKTATSSNYRAYKGIYYTTSLGGTYTFAKNTSGSSSNDNDGCVLIKYGGYIYGFFTNSNNNELYIRSSDGINWGTLSSWKAWHGGNSKLGRFQIYDGKLFFTPHVSPTALWGSNMIKYVPFASLSSNSGNCVSTQIVRLINGEFAGSFAIDKDNEILYAIGAYSDGSVVIYGYNLATNTASSGGVSIGSASNNICSCIISDGKLYIDAAAKIWYRPALKNADFSQFTNLMAAWNTSWVKETGSSEQSGSAVLYKIGDKIIRPYKINENHDSSSIAVFCYRINNTYTAFSALSSDTRCYLYVTSNEDDVELFDYDNN